MIDYQKILFFVFPKKLQSYHYFTTRFHLDMNGWISEKDFNKIFEPVLSTIKK